MRRGSTARTTHGPLPPIETNENCDFIADPGNEVCMLPFPDDYYTVPDPSSATGRRVHFNDRSDADERRRQAHRSGTVQRVGRLQPRLGDPRSRSPASKRRPTSRAMGAVPINKLQPVQTRNNAPVVVIDAETGQRWPIWTEIDSTAKNRPSACSRSTRPSTSPPATATSSRCANSKTRPKKTCEAPAGFRYLRDDVPTENEQINARRAALRRNLLDARRRRYRPQRACTWPGTSRSPATQNNTGRELSMRNRAFAQLGDENLENGVVEGVSPSFTVTSVENEPNPGQIARRVKGTFQVPCFLFPNCGAGRHDETQRRRQSDRKRHVDGELRLHHPAVRHDRRPPNRHDRRCTATGCSAMPRRWPRAPSAASRSRTTSSSARPTRSACPNRTCRP